MNDAASKHPRQSLIAFFSLEYRRLTGFVRSLISDAAEREGEDIVQDVAASLFESADIMAPVENLSAYVYQALRNRVVDSLRKRRTLVQFNDQEAGHLPSNGETGELGQRWELLAALDNLDEKSRSIVIATEIEGWSFEELAEQWDEPIGTLLSRKSRAIKKLRKIMSKKEIAD